MRLPLGLLLLGGAAGIVAAAHENRRAHAAARDALPPQAVALVNGRPIATADFARLARRAPDEVARQQALDRLIDDELLVQHGLESGVAVRDPRVRAELRAAVTAIVMREAPANPDTAALRRFYEERRADFPAPFAEAEPEVQAAYRAQAERDALRACLADLRARASIEILPEPQ